MDGERVNEEGVARGVTTRYEEPENYECASNRETNVVYDPQKLSWVGGGGSGEPRKQGRLEVVCSSLVRDTDRTLDCFEMAVLDVVGSHAQADVLVLPEYCWRNTPPALVFRVCEEVSKLAPAMAVVAGSLELSVNGVWGNYALVLHGGEMAYVPKTKLLAREQEQCMVPRKAGASWPNVFVLPRFTMGVCVCADLWEAPLLLDMVRRGVDCVAVPAWTACRQGNRMHAKAQWISLARVRSMEFSVCVAVADHLANRPCTDVANATCIMSLENRRVPLPINVLECSFTSAVLDLAQSHHARVRWAANGLAPLPPADHDADHD